MNEDKFTDEQLTVLAKVEKLLRLAAKNQNENEAAAATNKAMELLAAYNLDASAVDIDGSDPNSGKRAEEKLIGGFYQFERDLWRSISELNFVWYWTQTKYIPPSERHLHRGRVRTHQHVLIGKVVNIAATKAMAGYLMQAIERIVKVEADKVGMPPRSSWAVSFRKGSAERVIEKINARRWEMMEKEEQAAAEAVKRAREAGVANVETALTLAGVKEREDEGNYDFIHGKGASAKRNAERLKRREDQAKAEADAEAAYTKWAAEHPEEAAAAEKKAQAEERKRNQRWLNRRGRSYREPAFKGDWAAYSMGREAGAKIGIDPQAEGSRSKGELK